MTMPSPGKDDALSTAALLLDLGVDFEGEPRDLIGLR